jgi:hypothetical protein
MLPAETTDEADARRMFDELMIHERDDICMKGVQQQGLLAASTDDTDSTQKPTRRRRRRGLADGDDPVDLDALLLRCAQAVATPHQLATPRRGWRTASLTAWRRAWPARAAASTAR